MASTVKVPLLGTHNKGTVIGVTIGGVVVAGYLIIRNKKQAASQAAASQSAQAAATSAGYGYGQPIQPQGYYGYGEPGGGYGYGYGYGFGGGGFGGGGFGYGYGFPPPGPTPITTNAQWTQAAVRQLQQDGYQPQVVVPALGAYLLGREVTPQQQTVIQAAIAVEGYPPVSGKDGFPPGIKVSHGGQGGQGKDLDFVEAPGQQNLVQIGAAHDVARTTIDRLNPALFTRYGNRRDVPAGTKVRVH